MYSLLSPTKQALSQLVKGYKITISSTVLLASENKNLCMENQHQKGKRAQRRIYIARGGVLSGAKGASYAQTTRRGQQRGQQRGQPSDRGEHCQSVVYASQQNIIYVRALDGRQLASK